jgi:hypothetical protein
MAGPPFGTEQAVSGFFCLDAASFDEAEALAATWPPVVRLGGAVEVRGVDIG